MLRPLTGEQVIKYMHSEQFRHINPVTASRLKNSLCLIIPKTVKLKEKLY
jgi:hypothetical protein